ncbi:hypothetical protein [Streptosporangium sp. KLBMP 9127]|nr:hypothetical protein [Streptosporangium sp. KLBMP 9127]
MVSTSGPPMSAEGVQHALAHRQSQRDRLSGDLLDLEQHAGHQLLKGAELRGETKRRWDQAQADIATMWWLFDAYRRVIDRAENIWARSSKPGMAEQLELTALLTGASVEMKVEDVPVERRSLVRAAAEWLTLDQVMARMDTAYRDSAQMVAAADAAWSVLAPRVNEAEAALLAALELARALGTPDEELDRIGERVVRLRDEARTDPLTYANGDPRELVELDRVVAELTERRRVLDEAVRVKEAYDQRAAQLAGRIAEVSAAEGEVLVARDRVLVKIASPALPRMPDQARNLSDRFAALAGVRGRGDWAELARLMIDLDRAVDDALAQARDTTATVTGLLDRRDELRGRLDAFKAKAVRLGRAEDAQLGYLYRQAHDLLWTAPCDLRQATVAVAGYQRAIKEIGASG